MANIKETDIKVILEDLGYVEKEQIEEARSDIQDIEDDIKEIEKHMKALKSALAKYKKGGKYAPQIENAAESASTIAMYAKTMAHDLKKMK